MTPRSLLFALALALLTAIPAAAQTSCSLLGPVRHRNRVPGQSIYNARISVEVTGGTGRVAAYGSVIDNKSLDPTYVPAQSGQ